MRLCRLSGCWHGAHALKHTDAAARSEDTRVICCNSRCRAPPPSPTNLSFRDRAGSTFTLSLELAAAAASPVPASAAAAPASGGEVLAERSAASRRPRALPGVAGSPAAPLRAERGPPEQPRSGWSRGLGSGAGARPGNACVPVPQSWVALPHAYAPPQRAQGSVRCPTAQERRTLHGPGHKWHCGLVDAGRAGTWAWQGACRAAWRSRPAPASGAAGAARCRASSLAATGMNLL